MPCVLTFCPQPRCDRNLSGVLSALSIAERKEGGVDAHGYNACIGGMAKAKRWADALELLSRMRAAGVAPNTHCYSNAIVVCHRSHLGCL